MALGYLIGLSFFHKDSQWHLKNANTANPHCHNIPLCPLKLYELVQPLLVISLDLLDWEPIFQSKLVSSLGSISFFLCF